MVHRMKVAKKKKNVLISELQSKKFQTMEKIKKTGTIIRNKDHGEILREASDVRLMFFKHIRIYFWLCLICFECVWFPSFFCLSF